MPTARKYFRCPSCASTIIEEVSTCMSYSVIDSFVSSHAGGTCWYDFYEVETEELDVVRYQCRTCGFVACEGHAEPNLFTYLERKGWIKEEETEPVVSDWEV
jgi:predicted RNA-binding Zn-ribbon protein involved in translation (DUF1610 family)